MLDTRKIVICGSGGAVMHPLHLVIDSVGYIRAVRTIDSVIGVVEPPRVR
ncbi:hypothetical protein AAH978_21725 [Streptomyces sp. ZYX-F-203]